MASNLGLGTTSSVFRWDVKRPEQKRAKADGFLAFDGYTSDEHLVSDFIACNVCLHNQIAQALHWVARKILRK
jgi:hypothetical protein